MAERSFRSVAFYLPQFHPIPENDAWWGPGFTEWVNVVGARPLLRGHHQPELPSELGLYDLRLPDTRAAQASLAAGHGIDAFCYYHYWFEGRRLLERPFSEVLASGEPNFPFCLCWANENWTRAWSGGFKDVLMRQTYSEQDDLAHIRWLAEAFADPRYLRVAGRPVFLVYRAASLPRAAQTVETWRRESERLGVGDPFLCLVQSFDEDRRLDPREVGFDAAVRFSPDWRALGPRLGSDPLRRGVRKVFHRASPYRRHRFYRYEGVVAEALAAPRPDYELFPCVSPGFDNSPRRPRGDATVLLGSTAALYERWVRGAVASFATSADAGEALLFVNSWNEWGEGSQIEPSRDSGRSYLEAHARAVGRWQEPRQQPADTEQAALTAVASRPAGQPI